MAKFRNITVKDIKFKWTFIKDGAFIKCEDEKYKGNYKASCGDGLSVTPKNVAQWITLNIFKDVWVEAVKPVSTPDKNRKMVYQDTYLLIKRTWSKLEGYYNQYDDTILFVSDDPSIIINLHKEYSENNTNKEWESNSMCSTKIEYVRTSVKKIISM